MAKDYSGYGPAYKGLKTRDDVYIPKPVREFSGDDPYVRMAPIRGRIKDISFDESYTFIDRTLGFKVKRFLTYIVVWFIAIPANWLRYGLRVHGRSNIKRNRDLLRNGVMTVCNHVYRWDMISVFRVMPFRRACIPMYSEPFKGDDGWIMKHVGGVPIPDNTGGLKKFSEAVREAVDDRTWIHIFPESCSWNFYSPIRPFKPGSFNLAYRYGLPIVPLVISFRPRTGWRKIICKDEPLVDIHVGEPIIPDPGKPKMTEVKRMVDTAHHAMCDMAGILENPWPATMK